MFLPPLPPVAGHRPGGRSILEVLAAEHDQIATLCGELTGTGHARRRGQIAEVLTAVAVRHLSAEEQYLYPVVRTASPVGGRLADREESADRALRHALKALAGTAPSAPAFAVRSDEVATQLGRHIRATAGDLFPLLPAVYPEAELIRLGNRVEVAEEAAPTRPHPGTPVRPPWNRLVDPAVGVVDKIRDALTGRRTYVEDLSWRPRLW